MTDQKKRGLGRGLDALFRDARSEEAAFAPKIKRADEIVSSDGRVDSRHDAFAPLEYKAARQPPNGAPRRIAIDQLQPGKFQPRRHFDDAAIESLADSIAVHGVLQPLLVRALKGGMYEIIAGERRWRAAQRAQAHEVPVIIQDLDDKAALEIALIENLQREDLSALEEAEGYQRLMDEFSHTQDVLAHRLGKSRSHVSNMLRLLKLPKRVKQYMQDGKLSAGHARTLVGCETAESLAAVVVKRGLNVRQTENLVKNSVPGKGAAKKKPSKTFRTKDVDVLALEQKLSSEIGLQVAIDQKTDAAGFVRIEYKTLEQLDWIHMVLTQRQGIIR